MAETLQEKARRFMLELDTLGKSNFTKGDVKLMLNELSQTASETVRKPVEAEDTRTCREPVVCDNIRRGDVFIGHTVGGKARPWVVLHVAGERVSAMAMSSGQAQGGMFASKCRYWPDSHIGGTISFFRRDVASKEVTRPYTARSHLTEVEDFLNRTLFGRKPRKASVVKLRAVN